MKVVKWSEQRIGIGREPADLGLEYLSILRDPLDWGPQHPDLKTQHLMRCCYFGWPLIAYQEFDRCAEALMAGDEVVFWCEPVLASCLAVLWALDILVAHRADLGKAYLVLSPARFPAAEVIRRAFAERVPVIEALESLLAIRRHLASDSEEMRPDVSLLPSPVREWATVTEQLQDFLPDERGLDLIDSLLLDKLADIAPQPVASQPKTWPRAASVVSLYPEPGGHYFYDDRLWEHILQMSGLLGVRSHLSGAPNIKDVLIQVWFEGEPTLAHTRLRITPLGKRVREGKEDWLPRCSFTRWVGGRQVSQWRPLRRSPKVQATR